MSIRPFKVDVPHDEIARLKRKLQDTRLPKREIVPNAGDNYGAPLSWFQRLYHKFATLDWPATQAHLNRLDHFIASVTDPDNPSITLDIHFTHTKSPNPSAIPLLCVHGWPGSFYEFDHIINPLTQPTDPGSPSFHIIAPSIPGFMWSSPPPRRGWTLLDTARIFNTLMHQLSYPNYAVQGGDWGMFIVRELGSKYPSCRAIHLNFSPTALPPDLTESDLTPREKKIETRCQDWLDSHLGYAVLMRTRPQTLSFMLHDNPTGILAWVGEKYLELSNPAIHSAERWDDAIVTTCALYYFTGCIGTSGLLYYENVKHAEFGEWQIREENKVRCPMGYTSFLWDSRPGTRRGVERSGRLVWYREYDEGGHFAALECPEVIVDDLRSFMSEWYKQ